MKRKFSMKLSKLHLKTAFGSVALLGLIFTFQNCSPSATKTVTSLGAGASTVTASTDLSQTPTVKVDDMILDTTAAARQGISGKNMHLYSTTGFASYGSQSWPNGIIPLAFADNITASQAAMIRAACKEWGSASSVTCIDRTTETSYALVSNISADDCSANVGAGLSGGVRNIHLGDNCWTNSIVLHEFGHTIGFLHEHQRADRDQYITVHLENVAAAYQSNLTVLTRDSVQRDYDFSSIMHYASTAFSTNGLPTLVPVAAYSDQASLMGMSTALSSLDKKSINELYPIVSTSQPTPVVYSSHMIYRYISDDGQHLFAKGDKDHVPNNFSLEGPIFLLFDKKGPGMIGIQRCTWEEQMYLSNDPGCEGGHIVETIGYVATDASIANTAPLYRWSDDYGDYLHGQDQTEPLDNGFGYELELGYSPY